MKKVMVFGTFDLLHDGHLDFFKQAKVHGDFLIAVVARDSTVMVVKKHTAMFCETDRLKSVQDCGIVDLAVLGNKDDKFKVLEEHSPDIICLGYDQDSFTDKLQDELNRRNLSTAIVRLQPFKEHIFKSSKLKNELRK